MNNHGLYIKVLNYLESLSRNSLCIQFYIWFFIIPISALNVLHIPITYVIIYWYLKTLFIFINLTIFACIINDLYASNYLFIAGNL